jgi:hypothetical protein
MSFFKFLRLKISINFPPLRAYYVPLQSRRPWIDLPDNILLRVQIMKILIL